MEKILKLISELKIPAKTTIPGRIFEAGSVMNLPSLPCRHPADRRNVLELKIATELSEQLFKLNRNSKLMEIWAVMYGEAPPINNIGAFENHKNFSLTKLTDAHALFRGVKRGCNSVRDGSDVYIYLTKPKYTYEYTDHNPMVCFAKIVELEEKSVMATYVRLSGTPIAPGSIPKGEVIGWDFFTAENVDGTWLPENSTERFDERIW